MSITAEGNSLQWPAGKNFFGNPIDREKESSALKTLLAEKRIAGRSRQ